MPLKTFLNLTPTKQQEIINICMKEFSSNDFKSASFTKIAQQVGITKGGFYRYFESKAQLYNYLLNITTEIIGELLKKHFLGKNKNFFQAFEDYYLDLIARERDYPLFLPFVFKVSEDKAKNRQQLPVWKSRKMEFLQQMMQSQQEQGHIRKDLDPLSLSIYFQQCVKGILELCTLKYGLSYKNPRSPNKLLSHIPGETIKTEIANFIELMQSGLGVKSLKN